MKHEQPSWPIAMMTRNEIEACLDEIRQSLYDQIVKLPERWEDHVHRNPDEARIYSSLTRACWWNDQMCALVEAVLIDGGFTISRPRGHLRASRGSLILRFKKLYGWSGKSSSRTINRTFLEPTLDGFPLQTVAVIGYVADQHNRLIRDVMLTVPLADLVLHAESLQLSLFHEYTLSEQSDMRTKATIKVSQPKAKQQEERA